MRVSQISFLSLCNDSGKTTVLMIADLAEEDRKRLEEVYVQGPGGTIAPRAWSGWRAGREFEERKKQRGEEEVCHLSSSV